MGYYTSESERKAWNSSMQYMMKVLIDNDDKYDNQLIAISMFSIFRSAILNKIAFRMCGVFYKSRSNKTLGSIGYMNS